MTKFIEIFISILVALILGCFVRFIVKRAGKRVDTIPPEGIDKNEWHAIIHISTAAKLTGNLEILLSLAAFWLEAYVIIAGWFALKVAAKWETWKNIIQVPNSLENISPLSYLKARNAWGTYVMSKFLVGTISNVLAALFAMCIGKYFFEIVELVKTWSS